MKSGYVICKSNLLHRIIWETFNGEIPQGKEIDHIDCNKQNNALSNLRLITHSENVKLAYANKCRKPNTTHTNVLVGVTLVQSTKNTLDKQKVMMSKSIAVNGITTNIMVSVVGNKFI